MRSNFQARSNIHLIKDSLLHCLLAPVAAAPHTRTQIKSFSLSTPKWFYIKTSALFNTWLPIFLICQRLKGRKEEKQHRFKNSSRERRERWSLAKKLLHWKIITSPREFVTSPTRCSYSVSLKYVFDKKARKVVRCGSPVRGDSFGWGLRTAALGTWCRSPPWSPSGNCCHFVSDRQGLKKIRREHFLNGIH